MATRKKVIPSYSAELKQKLVELVRSGKSPDVLAEEYPPSAQTIRNWVAKANRAEQPAPRVGAPEGGMGMAGMREEIARLRKVVQAMTMEAYALRQLAKIAIEDSPKWEIPASPFEVDGARTD